MKRYLVVNGWTELSDFNFRERVSTCIDHYSNGRATDGDWIPLCPIYRPDDVWLLKNIREVEVVFGWFGERFITNATALTWLQLQGAGPEEALKTFRDRPDVIITNASGVHAVPIAEHFLSMIFAFARKLPDFYRQQLSKDWNRDTADSMTEVAGKHALVVGYGAIGRVFAEKAAALGMSVTGIKRTGGSETDGDISIASPNALLDLLPAADYVVNILPYTTESDRMFGADEFAAMKSTACFFNAGRGKTVDESAMIHALQSGGIAGAGLDVFEIERLPEDSPLWEMENVIITPHIAGLTPKYNERLVEIFIENLGRYLRGNELINRVYHELGY